ncbi:DUF3325 domain-containing protein [Nitrospira sp. T9]|uniref:DUF3325 domain-containing protein n=1 Tax=unclassified Nitrospira TaxID=2652172 RepID=UPI003F9EA3AC
MDILVFLLSYGGLFTLCLAMPKHYQAILGQSFLPSNPSPVLLILKIVGCLILGLSLVVAVATAGWSFGPVHWVGFLSMGGLTLIFVLSYAPRLALIFGFLSLFSVLLILLIHWTQPQF